MTKDDFMQFVVTPVLAEIEIMWKTKGDAYAPDQSDRLSNFKQVGEQVGLTPMQVWSVYCSKHRIAIDSFVRRGCKDLPGDEPIEGRVLDNIVYLLLFRGLLWEMRQTAANKVNDNLADLNHLSDPEAYVALKEALGNKATK